jgi:hypothetical protein
MSSRIANYEELKAGLAGTKYGLYFNRITPAVLRNRPSRQGVRLTVTYVIDGQSARDQFPQKASGAKRRTN